MSSIALARAYRRSFEAYPHRTLAIAGGALTAFGDVVAQLSQQLVRIPLPHTYDNISNHLSRLRPKITMNRDPTTTLLALSAFLSLERA
jgi:hypothetical protein